MHCRIHRKHIINSEKTLLGNFFLGCHMFSKISMAIKEGRSYKNGHTSQTKTIIKGIGRVNHSSAISKLSY